jgi:hypothetical protein
MLLFTQLFFAFTKLFSCLVNYFSVGTSWLGAVGVDFGVGLTMLSRPRGDRGISPGAWGGGWSLRHPRRAKEPKGGKGS